MLAGREPSRARLEGARAQFPALKRQRSRGRLGVVLKNGKAEHQRSFDAALRATFDENSVPPWTGGTSGGSERGNQPTPALRATPPKEGIFRRTQCEAPPVFSFPVARSMTTPAPSAPPPLLRGNAFTFQEGQTQLMRALFPSPADRPILPQSLPSSCKTSRSFRPERFRTPNE